MQAFPPRGSAQCASTPCPRSAASVLHFAFQIPIFVLVMDWLLDLGYFGLFIGSFLAATIVPFSADVLLIGMLVAGGSPWIVIAIATAGNFLGGLTSYGIGRIGKWEWIERLGAKPETIAKHKAKIDRYGAWLALLSWVPFVGDIFAVALGFYRTKFVPTALFMLIGKFGRFVAWYGLWPLTATH